VRLKFAEELNGGFELVRREMLIAHDQNMVFGESLIQSRAGLSIDRLPEIETDHFGAGVSSKRRDCEGRHGHSSPVRFFQNAIAVRIGDQGMAAGTREDGRV
jgi:hypothetical protein